MSKLKINDTLTVAEGSACPTHSGIDVQIHV